MGCWVGPQLTTNSTLRGLFHTPRSRARCCISSSPSPFPETDLRTCLLTVWRRFMGAELERKRAGKKTQTGMSEKEMAGKKKS